MLLRPVIQFAFIGLEPLSIPRYFHCASPSRELYSPNASLSFVCVCMKLRVQVRMELRKKYFQKKTRLILPPLRYHDKAKFLWTRICEGVWKMCFH